MNSEMILKLLLSFITSLFLFFLIKKMMTKKKKKNLDRLPPCPPKLPIIGNLHQIGGMPHRSLLKLSNSYGDIMLLQLGSVPTLIVSSADMAREIFKSHDLVFSGRPPIYVAKKFSFDSSSVSLAPYGHYWRQIRKVVVLELMTVKRVQSFAKIRDDEVGLLATSIAHHARTSATPLNLSALLFSLTNNIVCRVAFGTPSDAAKTDGNTSKFQDLLHELQNLAGEFNVADYFPRMAWVNKFNGVDKKLDKHFRDLDGYFDKVLEDHRDPKRRRTDHEDIIDVLLGVQKDPDQEIALKDEHIKGVLFDIFAAGTDTSYATIAWAMSELARNPELKEKAQQEVRKACEGKVKVEETDLHKLTYLKQIIKETLRLHPPAPLMLPRETIDKCTIRNKYDIPTKTRVIFNALAIGSDPKYWQNPEMFQPERFCNSETDFKGQHFEFLPFGSGRRICPGINFAMAVVEIALANLLFLFDWEVPSADDVDMRESMGVVVNKKFPLRLLASNHVL